MVLQRWKWWQWLVTSLIVGALLGFGFTRQDVDDPSIPSIALNQFMRKLQIRTDKGDSVVTDIRISPPMPDVQGKTMNAVTFWESEKRKSTGNWEPVRQWRMYAPTPLYIRAPRPDYSIVDFLAEKKKDIPSLDYGIRWWQVPRNMFLLCMGSSVLLIGVIWPMVMRALVKVGLGAPEEVEEPSGLSSVHTSSSDTNIPTRAGVTTADREQLSALNAQLESNVAGMALAGSATADAEDDAKVEQAIRELPNAPLEAMAAAKTKASDDDFKGEYYPVARPVAKKA